MQIEAIRTSLVCHKQPLTEFVGAHLQNISDNDILVITSKVVSICEGRTVSKEAVTKDELVRREADKIVPNPHAVDKRVVLTLKDNMLLPSAGIDESNANNTYVMYPTDSFASARSLWSFLREKYHLKRVGVLITDSRTTPLRRGVTGIALAWWGFSPLWSYVGQRDLFDRVLSMTCINVVDALATSAVFEMGEGNECTPLAIIKNARRVNFDECSHDAKEVKISMEEDLYRPLLEPLL